MKELEERQKRYTKMLVLVHNLERHYGSMTRVPDDDKELKKLRKLANLKAYEDHEAFIRQGFLYRVDNWDGFTIHFARIWDINRALFNSPSRVSFKELRKKLEKKGASLSIDRKSELRLGDFYVASGTVAIKQVSPVGKVVA